MLLNDDSPYGNIRFNKTIPPRIISYKNTFEYVSAVGRDFRSVEQKYICLFVTLRTITIRHRKASFFRAN
jgi:hypothetical protein